MQAAPSVLRPKRSSFLFGRVVPVAVFFGLLASVVGIALVAAGLGSFALVPLGAWLLLVLLTVGTAAVAYKKERYELHPGRIVAHSGGLFSDRQADLELRNVTHVKQRLPWLRYRFFDVGDVLVESAGSSGSQVVLRSVVDPDRIYATVRESLRNNGYALRQQTLLHEEKPDPIGVAVEIAGLGVGLAIGFVWFVVGLLTSVVVEMDISAKEMAEFGGQTPEFLWPLLAYGMPVAILLGTVVMLGLRYLDLRRRTYRVYDDVVVYEEGFLNRTNAFIPYENIADADIVKTFVDQMLGLSDITVSCQGSGSEVKFRRLRRGAELKEAVGQLVTAANAKRRASAPRAAADGEVGAARGPDGEVGAGFAEDRPKRAGAEGLGLVAPEDAWTATLKPVPLRAVASVIGMLPLFPFWLIASGTAWVLARATTYSVKPTSVSVRTGILSVKEREYSYEKVTGVVVKSTPFDRIFGTMSVQIWSIGSTLPLDLGHVAADEVDLPRLLRNLGVDPGPAVRSLPARFGLDTWLRSALPGFLLLLAFTALVVAGALFTGEAIVGVLVLLPALILLFGFFFRRAWTARQEFTLHPTHAELKNGIWWRKHFYAPYADVKKLKVTRFPGGVDGNLQVFVAGERIVQNNNNNAAPVPYSLTARYLTDTVGLSATLDELLAGHRTVADASPPQRHRVELEVQPALANSMVGAAFASLLLLPFAIFILPYTYVSVRRRRYRLEPDRVVRAEGILFRTETSVLYERIDSMRQDQGALGKVFGNGQVTLFTAGSSRPDLALTAVADRQRVYDAIRARYAG